MKRYFFLIALAVGLLFSTTVLAQEKIDNFETTIQLNQDSSLVIEEKITYDFGQALRHGIYRDIIIKYKARGGNYNLRVSDIKVVDENDQPYNFEVSYPNKYVRIKIGDADKEISGRKIYKIRYKIQRAINYFNDYDELYWNATGNEWSVAINKAKTLVFLPQEIKASQLQKACFTGSYGETKECSGNQAMGDSDHLVKTLVFEENNLEPQNGLTIVVGLPKGIINEPNFWQSAWETFKDNLILLLPLIILIFFLRWWYKYGRDPQGRGTIVAEFEAPDNLTAAEVGTIIDEHAQYKDLSAEIISLAVRGYLKITRLKEGKLFKKTDYSLEQLKSADDLENKFDKELMQSFFSGGKEVKLSSLKNKLSKKLKEIVKLIYETVTNKGYFVKSPAKVRTKYIIISVIFFFLAFWLGGVFFGTLGVVSFIICGIIILIFSFLMPARTKKGVLAREHILGLKNYLQVAEKDRLKFHNAPAKNPAHFEKLLPYAMVLGVEKEWAKQFEDIYKQNPSWYNDSTLTHFTALAFVNNLHSFQSQAQSTMSYAHSASASGSGFSGGGFSGGGFGGGGGGSW